jgi:molybdopterin synthase sulfur carrier subunit
LPTVTFELPSVLEPIIGQRREIRVEAETLAGALEALVADRPALRTHLFDESAGFRQHVLCFHNGVNTRWLDGVDRPVADGDTITILQAVSGG